jgi:uncharacterized ferredoxin-like protein
MAISKLAVSLLFVVAIASASTTAAAMKLDKQLLELLVAGFNRPCLLDADVMAPIPCSAQ